VLFNSLARNRGSFDEYPTLTKPGIAGLVMIYTTNRHKLRFLR
jgi:hypothetical protein